jgi:CRP/FNR family cyclic AMP-dependent transcriptional regulator
VKGYIQCLRKVNLFAALGENELEVIARIAHERTFGKGHVVFQEGEAGDALYIILKGKVKVSLYDESGREYILDIIADEGFFGELSLIDDLPRSANVITMDNSELLVIHRQDFTRLLIENPSITINMLKTCSRRLRSADERIKGLAFYSVEGRILKYLIDYGRQYGSKVRNYVIIENGPTQIEIASNCGCSRETVSRMLKNLINKGIISVRKRQYTLNPVYAFY